MNLILQAIKSLFRKLENAIPKKLSELENDLKLSELENDLKLSAPDWNQNDPEGEGYIKNRPFYNEKGRRLVVEGVPNQYGIYSDLHFAQSLQVGVEYTYFIDGVAYTSKAYFDDTDACAAVIFWENNDNYNGEYIATVYESYISLGQKFDYSVSHTIERPDTVYHTIDESFIPTVIPRVSNALVGQTLRVAGVDANGVPTRWEPTSLGQWSYINYANPDIVIDGESLDISELIVDVDDSNRPFNVRRMYIIIEIHAPLDSPLVLSANGYKFVVESGIFPDAGYNKKECYFAVEYESVGAFTKVRSYEGAYGADPRLKDEYIDLMNNVWFYETRLARKDGGIISGLNMSIYGM